MKEAFESAFSKNPDINPAFRETLTESLKKHSESGKSLDEIRKDERTKIHQTEEQLAKLSRFEKFISAWLDRYNLHANIRKNEAGNLEIPLTNISEIIPELPEGYGYKGSAARTIMQYALGMQFESPRDLDIVFFGSDENPEVSKELAMKYMPDDYLGGHGVERAEPDYFKTRDFTINEVRYDGERVEFTLQCLKDLLRNIVRFSKYEKQESYRGDKFFVKPKLLAKAIRLVAESESRGKKNARLADETLDLNHMYIDDFHMSLHLIELCKEEKMWLNYTYHIWLKINIFLKTSFL